MSGLDRSTVPTRCGCLVVLNDGSPFAEVRHCPLHALASEMLRTLREAERTIEALYVDGYDPDDYEAVCNTRETLESVRYTIERAEAGRPFRDWLAYKAPEALGTSGRSALLIETDPAGRRVLLDAEGLFAPQWIPVPEGIPVPTLPREGRP